MDRVSRSCVTTLSLAACLWGTHRIRGLDILVRLLLAVDVIVILIFELDSKRAFIWAKLMVMSPLRIVVDGVLGLCTANATVIPYLSSCRHCKVLEERRDLEGMLVV